MVGAGHRTTGRPGLSSKGLGTFDILNLKFQSEVLYVISHVSGSLNVGQTRTSYCGLGAEVQYAYTLHL